MLLRSGAARMRLRYSHLEFRRPRRRSRSKLRTRKYEAKPLVYFSESQCAVSNGTCTPHKCATTYLTNHHGQWVTLSKRNGLKLVATDAQKGTITCNLEIWKWDKNIAFCFKYGSEIYLVTESEQKKNELELKLITDDAKRTIQNLHPWFQMKNVGSHCYCIQTASSNKYLTIDTRTRNPLITLSEEQATDSTFSTSPCQCNEEGCPGV